MLLNIEGIDGAGKTEQAQRLATWLSERATHPASVQHFPNYETQTGQLIRDHLFRRWSTELTVVDPRGSQYVLAQRRDLDALVFQALQTVNRLELAPTLSRAKGQPSHLVLDRYWPSGFVYGSADGLDPKWLVDVHATLPQPDVFILLDADPKIAAQRCAAKGADRYEKAGFLEKCAGLYRELWAMKPVRADWVVVDANRSADEVAAAVQSAVTSFLVDSNLAGEFDW